MITSARYVDAGHTLVEAVIDGRTYQQVAAGGEVGQIIAAWIAEGNTPSAYSAPPPSADQIRREAFKSDIERNDLLDKIKTATPAQIKSYVTANVTNLAEARVLLSKIMLLLATEIRG